MPRRLVNVRISLLEQQQGQPRISRVTGIMKGHSSGKFGGHVTMCHEVRNYTCEVGPRSTNQKKKKIKKSKNLVSRNQLTLALFWLSILGPNFAVVLSCVWLQAWQWESSFGCEWYAMMSTAIAFQQGFHTQSRHWCHKLPIARCSLIRAHPQGGFALQEKEGTNTKWRRSMDVSYLCKPLSFVLS